MMLICRRSKQARLIFYSEQFLEPNEESDNDRKIK
jgi:hypothetical protein